MYFSSFTATKVIYSSPFTKRRENILTIKFSPQRTNKTGEVKIALELTEHCSGTLHATVSSSMANMCLMLYN
jgi:hypothetical protein